MGLFTDGFKELKKAREPLYKTPKSIQETIEIMKVAENGIFEVAKNRFSKCYRFQDINYTTTNEVEQIDIFERYCKFLNSLDVSFKITINNKNKWRTPRASMTAPVKRWIRLRILCGRLRSYSGTPKSRSGRSGISCWKALPAGGSKTSNWISHRISGRIFGAPLSLTAP